MQNGGVNDWAPWYVTQDTWNASQNSTYVNPCVMLKNNNKRGVR